MKNEIREVIRVTEELKDSYSRHRKELGKLLFGDTVVDWNIDKDSNGTYIKATYLVDESWDGSKEYKEFRINPGFITNHLKDKELIK